MSDFKIIKEQRRIYGSGAGRTALVSVERKKKELKIKFPEIDTKIVSYRKSFLLYLD